MLSLFHHRPRRHRHRPLEHWMIFTDRMFRHMAVSAKCRFLVQASILVRHLEYLMKGLILAAALTATPSAPIWQLYPHLVCHYEEAQFCDFTLVHCDAQRGTAVVAFDFPQKEVRSVSMTHATKIEAFSFLDLPGDITGVSTIYTNGALYSFMKISKSENGTDTDRIDGFVQMPSIDSALTAHMVCRPLD